MTIKVYKETKRIEVIVDEELKDKMIATVYKIIRKYRGDMDWEPKGENKIAIYYYAPNGKALEKAKEKLEKALIV